MHPFKGGLEMVELRWSGRAILQPGLELRQRVDSYAVGKH